MDIFPNRRDIIKAFSLVFLIFFFGCFTSEAVTVQTGSFNLKVSGEKTWGLEFGVGSSESLSKKGYPDNSFELKQSLTVKVEGTIGPYLSLNADLNDKRPNYLQKFNLKLETENWDGILGDYTLGGKEGFTVYNKEVRGIGVNGKLGRYELDASLARVMGISKTKVFYGHSAEDQVTFSFYSDDGREESPYRQSIKGLYFYPLQQEYVEEFTEPSILLLEGPDLWSFLENRDLGYLKGKIEAEPSKPLLSGQFRPLITEEKDYLLLMRKIKGLLRSRLKYYIALYNSEEEPEEEKEYPFNEGTEYETNFLNKLQKLTRLEVDQQKIMWKDYGRKRFYYLGHSGIKEDTLDVEVKKNGQWESIDDLKNYGTTLYSSRGVLELNFPDSFWENLRENKVKVGFRYNLSGSMFMLGFSVTPGSEKVYLNGKLLQKNTDYSINYETGALILFKDITGDDKLKVDYEQARGGIGGYSEYKRNIYGFNMQFRTDFGMKVTAEVYQAKDMSASGISPTVSIMPNTHTVAGLKGEYSKEGWDVGFRVAGSIDRFPSDDNKRKHLPNRVNDIEYFTYGGGNFYVFAHQNGIAVYDGVSWSSYDASDGLASNIVKDIAKTEGGLYFATSSGITRLELEGSAIFARKDNWKSFYESDGMPVEDTLCVLQDGDYLWVGTEEGLLRGKTGSLGKEEGWRKVADSKLQDLSISSLEKIGDQIFLGTSSGLYLLDIRDSLVVDRLVSDTRIRDLAKFNGRVYVATEWGVISYGKSLSQRWEVTNRNVHSLSVSGGGDLWYGTEDGFYNAGNSARYGSGLITSILARESGTWATARGREVEEDKFDLEVYRVSDEVSKYGTDKTGIRGKDESHYRDISPEGHVDRGVFFRSDLAKTFNIGSLPLDVSSKFSLYQPGYSPIGKDNEEDRLRWNVSLKSDIRKGLTLSGSRNYRIKNFSSGDPSQVTQYKAKLDYVSFVDFSLLGKVKQVDQSSRSIHLKSSLSDTLYSGKVAWELGLSGEESKDLKTGRTDLGAQINGRLNLNPIQALSLGLGYKYPLQFGEFSGGEDKLDWNAEFSRGVNIWNDYGFKLKLKDKGSLSNLIGEKGGSLQNKLSSEMRLDKFGGEDFNLSPFVSLSWDKKPGEDKLKGKLTAHGTLYEVESRLTLSRELTLDATSERTKAKDNLSGKMKFQKTSLQLPTVDFSVSRVQVAHPAYGEKSEIKAQLSLKETLSTFGNGKSDYSLSIKYVQDKGLFYSLSSDTSWKISENLKPKLSLSSQYETKKEEFSFAAECSVSYRISKLWNLSFESGWALNTTTQGYLDTSFYGSTSLIARF